jgi:hypothetical protein
MSRALGFYTRSSNEIKSLLSTSSSNKLLRLNNPWNSAMPLSFIIPLVICVFSINAISQTAPSSDPQALSIAQKSLAALTGGVAVADVSLYGSVTSISGSDNETGTAVMQAKGGSESRIDLTLNGGTRSDVRNVVSGIPGGAWQKSGDAATRYASHNCWTDATWFFPAFSSLSRFSDPNFLFTYIGPETWSDLSTVHLRVQQLSSKFPLVSQLSATEFYLDPATFLPLGIAFQSHSDTDVNVNIPTVIRFANYQSISGVQVPFHIQRMFNGTVTLDMIATRTIINSTLLDSIFTLQ